MQSAVMTADAFEQALQLSRRRLTMLTCAIGTGSYFDAWLGAMQLRAALDDAERVACLMAAEFWPSARQRIRSLRVIAAPMLALAPRPNRTEVRQLRTSNASADSNAWERSEWRWRSRVLRGRFPGVMHLSDVDSYYTTDGSSSDGHNSTPVVS